MTALRTTGSGGSVSSNASQSITQPTGVSVGDLVLFFIVASNHAGLGPAAIGTATGFTATADTAGSNTDFHARGFGRVIDGTESWPLTVTTTSTTAAWTLACYSSAGSWDPSTMVAPLYSSTATIMAANAITLANANDWIAWFAASCRDANTTTATVTVPTGYTSQAVSTLFQNSGSPSMAQSTFADLETAQSSGSFTAANGTISSGVAHFVWVTGIQTGTTTLLTGVPAAQTITAPAGSENVAVAGPAATISVTAPTGSLPKTWTGATAPISITAPAGSMVNLQALFGVAAPITVTARAGTIAQTITAPTATVAVTAPAGFLNTALIGTPAQIQVNAFAGGLSNAVITYNNPWYGNQLSPQEADFEGPTVP